MTVVRVALLALVGALVCIAAEPLAGASEEHDATFKRSVVALQKGDFSTAITELEGLGDRGFVHPDASFDRGLAYVARVRAGADRPGDLGRAAAAFAEALALRDDDREASAALDAVRAEVARRRAKQGKEVLQSRPSIDRALMGLMSVRAWSIASFFASLMLVIALVLRRREGALHVAGSVLTPMSGFALLLLVPITAGARHVRDTTREGVVVVSEAHVTDELGTTKGNDPIPEAASVEVSERRGANVHVRWGSLEGWVPAASVRTITAP